MSRELYRVPLDFDAPIGKTYQVETNPYLEHGHDCEKCDGRGESKLMRKLSDLWYGKIPFKPSDRDSVPYTEESEPVWAFAKRNVEHSPEYYGVGEEAIRKEAKRLASVFNSQWSYHLNQFDIDVLIENDALKEFTHDYVRGEGWVPKDVQPEITPQSVNDWFINDRFNASSKYFYYIGIAECKRLGQSHHCDACDGQGEIWDSPENKELAKSWEHPPVPTGDGYQMWSGTFDGPISPVFGTPEELAEYMVKNPRSSLDKGYDYDGWLKFINEIGWMPSGIIVAGKENK